MLKRRYLVGKLLILLIAAGGVLGESRALDLLELSESFSVDFSAPGLSEPQGIAFHPVRKSLFVALRRPGRLLEFDWSGSLLSEYSVSPMTDIPEGVAYDWVTGYLLFVKGNTEVFYLDPDEPAEEPGLFALAGAPVEAKGIAVHPLTGNLFLTDGPGDRIVEFDRDGAFVSSIDLAGEGLLDPQGLSFYGTDLLVADDVDSSSSLALVSPQGELLQRVDTAGAIGIGDPDGVTVLGQRLLCIAGDGDARVACFENRVSSVSIPTSPVGEGFFVGLSLVNSSAEENAINVFGYDSYGRQTLYAQLPPIPSRAQSSVLVEELLSMAPKTSGFRRQPADSERATASLLLQGQRGPIQGFFMTGDFRRRRLDGIGLALEESDALYFPHTPLQPDSEVRLFLTNTHLQASTAELSLFDPQGSLIGEHLLEIPAFGSFQSGLQKLFGNQLPEAYLRVRSTAALVGFETVLEEDALSMLQGQQRSDARISFAPHVYTAGNGATTQIRIVNTSGGQANQHRLRLLSPQGEVLGEVVLILDPGEMITADFSSLFGPISSLKGGIFQGSLGMEAFGEDLGPFQRPAEYVSSITYLGNRSRTVTMLPLAARPFRHHLFSWVANSRNAAIRQGLAILNPQPVPVELTLRVRGPGGDIRLEKSLVIAAREKRVGLLDEPIFFGPTFSQIGGSLEVTAAAETLVTSVFVGPHYLSYIEGQAPLDSGE